MSMKMSDEGIAMLIASEGLVPGPYLDSVGVWTYGVGHTKAAGSPDPAKMPRGMPKDLDAEIKKAIDLFRQDLSKYEKEVNAALKVPVRKQQFDALVHFHYNTGAIGRATLVANLNNGDNEAAARNFMSWSKPKEIVPRRREEQALFMHGIYPKKKASVWSVDENGKVKWTAVKTMSMEDMLSLFHQSAAQDEKKEEIEPENVDPTRPILRIGSSGPAVAFIQRYLANYGYPVGRPDGIFGIKTNNGVMKFQRDRGIAQDGVVGPATWKFIKKG